MHKPKLSFEFAFVRLRLDKKLLDDSHFRDPNVEKMRWQVLHYGRWAVTLGGMSHEGRLLESYRPRRLTSNYCRYDLTQ